MLRFVVDPLDTADIFSLWACPRGQLCPVIYRSRLKGLSVFFKRLMHSMNLLSLILSILAMKHLEMDIFVSLSMLTLRTFDTGHTYWHLRFSFEGLFFTGRGTFDLAFGADGVMECTRFLILVFSILFYMTWSFFMHGVSCE